MKETCPMETAILRAVRSSSSTEEQIEHLAGCEACRAAVTVDGVLVARSRSIESSGHRLPPASVVWIQALIERRRGLDDELGRAQRRYRTLGWGVVAISWLAFVMLEGPALLDWLARLDAAAIVVGGAAAQQTLPAGIVITLAALLVITATVAVQDALVGT